jgi:peroxiredoxin
MKNKILLAGVMIVVISLLGWWLNTRPAAPQVSFKTIDNRFFKLQDFHGQPVIVTFWATNCPSCLKEIPDFLDLYQHFHAQGLEIIAVSMPYDIPSHVVALKQRLAIPYPLVLDLQGKINAAFGGVALTPTSFLISPDGKIAWRQTGRFSVEELHKRITTLLPPQ